MTKLKKGTKKMTKLKWCDKASEMARTLHLSNIANAGVSENSKEALTAIGKAVAAHVGHTGDAPNFHGVRSKLSGGKDSVYIAKSTSTNTPKGGLSISKATIVDSLKKVMGIDLSISTLTNGNRTELEAVVERAVVMDTMLVHNCTDKQALLDQIEVLEEMELQALAAGVSAADIAKAEDLANDIVSGES